MKHIILVFGLLLPLGSQAQSTPLSANKQNDTYGQGRVMVGATVGGGWGGFVGAVGHVVPRVQYFLKDGWSVAVQGEYILSGRQYQFVGVGLTTRYYFLRTSRWSLFGQAGYVYGQSRLRPVILSASPLRFDQPIYQRSGAVNVGLGAQYRLGKRWHAEFMFDQNYGTFRQAGWRGNVGINYSFGR